MNHNIIILLIGIVIIVTALYFLFKRDLKLESLSEEYCINPYIDKDDLQEAIRISEDKILREINSINIEIEEMKEAIKEINKSIYINSNVSASSNTENNEGDTFGNVLNYNKFVHKNKNIIELFNQNKTPEEIAQRLNKSVREIEMIVKLIK